MSNATLLLLAYFNENDKIIKRRRGLYGGNLIVNIYLKNIIRSEWNTLNKECKDNMIRILKTI